MTSPLSKASCPAMSEPTCKKVFIATVSILAIAALVGTVLLSIQASGNPTPGLITAATCLGVLTALSITSSLVLTLHKKQIQKNKSKIPLRITDQEFPNVKFERLNSNDLNKAMDIHIPFANSTITETFPDLPQYSHMQYLQFLFKDGKTHKGVSKTDAQKYFMRTPSNTQQKPHENEHLQEIIPFLFPTPDKSLSNPNVPPLTTEEYNILNNCNSYVQLAISAHLKLILNYYGMTISTTDDLNDSISIDPRAFELIKNNDFCSTASIILSSLKHFNCHNELAIFSKALSRLYSEITSQPKMNSNLRKQFILEKPVWDSIINSQTQET